MTGDSRKRPQRKLKRGAKSEQIVPEMEKEAFALNQEHEKLLHWFETVKFRKVLFGGVDETQLWKKLEELDKLYEAALGAERARYDALLEKQREASDALILKYKQVLEQGGGTGHSSRNAAPASRPDGEEQMDAQ